MDIKFEIHDNFDHIIEEKGNTFIALRKLSWNGREPKYDIRKWYNTTDGETRPDKGVGLSEEGIDELTNILLSQGFGKTDEILEAIKDRDDFERSYDKVIKGIIFDDEDDTFYDPREVLFNKEEEEIDG